MRKEHFHDFYSILLFTKGHSRIKINNDSYEVGPQTICLLAPNQMHSFEGTCEVEAEIFFFCQDYYVEEFSFIRLLNIFSYTSRIDSSPGHPCFDLSEGEFNSVISILRSVQQEYESFTPTNNSAAIIRSLLNIMLLKLTGLYESKSGKPNKGDNTLIHSLSNLVESYFIQEQKIRFYTAAFNITEKHLNDICNRHFNCGLKKILHDRLMQESRRLLLSSELSVSEIAYKLNFEDNSYFTKVFKSSTGLTPKRFRDMHKKLLP